MGGDILYGTWVPAEQQFFLWGEALELVRRKRDLQFSRPSHPYHCSVVTLRDRLTPDLSIPSLI